MAPDAAEGADIRVCSVNGGVHDQKTYDAALEQARASGRPMCRASGIVGPCVTWPAADGYCHWHRHPRYKRADAGEAR